MGTATSTTALFRSPEKVAQEAHPHPSEIDPANIPSDESKTSDLGPDGYPPQLHAGKVGYGPEYGKGAGFADKVGGMKEQLVGKMKHDEGMIQHGKERQAGMTHENTTYKTPYQAEREDQLAHRI